VIHRLEWSVRFSTAAAAAAAAAYRNTVIDYVSRGQRENRAAATCDSLNLAMR